MNTYEILTSLPQDEPDICGSMLLSHMFFEGIWKTEQFSTEWGSTDTPPGLITGYVFEEIDKLLANKVIVKGFRGSTGTLLGLMDFVTEFGGLEVAQLDATAAKIFWNLMAAVPPPNMELLLEQHEERKQEEVRRHAAMPPHWQEAINSMHKLTEAEFIDGIQQRPRLYSASAVGIFAFLKGYAHYKSKIVGENSWSRWLHVLYETIPRSARAQCLVYDYYLKREILVMSSDPVIAFLAALGEEKGHPWIIESWSKFVTEKQPGTA